MKLFRSIRWRLQMWYGALLLLVLVAFGYTAMLLVRDSRLRTIDEGLQQRLAALQEHLRPVAPREGPPFGGRPGGGWGGRRGRGLDLPEDESAEGPPADVEFPARVEALFVVEDANGYYYSIWTPRGLLRQSEGAPKGLRFLESRVGGGRGESFRTRDDYRELLLMNARGLTLLVGRSMAPELADLRRLSLLMVLAGVAFLVCGLAGGWWVASRAIQPIDEISRAAQRMAADNLTERISTSDADSELGQLAVVLNSTFARLQEAFNRQIQFTADASHELRTPLSVVLSQTQTTLARERSAGEYCEALEACQRAAQRMRRLVESLLQLARLDAGNDSAVRMPCELGQLADDVVRMLRALAAEAEVELVLTREPAICVGDPDQLNQVLTNLINNAIQHSATGTEVEINVTTRDGYCLVSVADHGAGISPKDLHHLFDRFYRADQARSRGSGRTGLGLAISRAIVEAHGGTIEVTSEPGQGSVFTVRLPEEIRGGGVQD